MSSFNWKFILIAIFFFRPLLLSAQEYRNDEADQIVSGSSFVVRDNKSGTIALVRQEKYVPSASGKDWLKTVVLHLRSEDDLVLISEQTDELNFHHYKYQQYYKDVPVEQGQYIIHTKEDRVISANGKFVKDLNIDPVPKVTIQSACDSAILHVASEKLNPEVNSLRSGKLVIIQFNEEFFLAYRFDVYSLSPLRRVYVYVDALNGNYIFEIDRLHTLDVIGTGHTLYSGVQSITTTQIGSSSYSLNETGHGGGINTYSLDGETSFSYFNYVYDNDNNWTDTLSLLAPAVDVHYGLERTFDYYLTRFGRNSFDNAAAPVNGYVNYDENYANAFWDGDHLTFGDGNGSTFKPLTSLEVVAHEYAHAVTEHSADLMYMSDPGALNEAFSDIFGVVIDFNEHPLTANYLIGENVTVNGLALRSMSEPNSYGCPDTYLGQYWDYGFFFGGDPHINSGVGNYCFYLLSEGGHGINDKGDSYYVSGIGRDKASAIAYRALTVYFTRYTMYMDARNLFLQAAIDLYGDCSNEVIQTNNAWYAVGLGSVYSDALVAGFVIPSPVFCHIPAEVQIRDYSINANTWKWNFGDGDSSTLQNPVHTYTAYGTYDLQLIVTGSSFCNSVDTFSISVTVSSGGPVTASCSPQTLSACCRAGILKVDLNDLHSLSGSAEEGYRDFTCEKTAHLVAGDNYPMNVITGKYLPENVKSWIDFDNNGIFSDSELVFESNNKLMYHLGVLHTSVFATLYTPLRLRIISDLSNNGSLSSCSNPVNGQAEDYTVIFSPNTLAPIADFTSDIQVVKPGETVHFSDLSLHAPDHWLWTFEDGYPASSTQQNPRIEYNIPGDFMVKLVVTNSLGTDSIVKVDYIHVGQNIMCMDSVSHEFSGQLSSIPEIANNYNQFDCSFRISLPCPVDISIRFNKFDIEPGVSFVKIYDGNSTSATLIFAGAFDSIPALPIVAHSGSALIVYVRNSGYNLPSDHGFNLTWTANQSLNSSTFANFNPDNSLPALFTPVVFRDASSGNPHSWHWIFDDGYQTTVQNPIHAFNTPGTHLVRLISFTCTSVDTVEKTIFVQTPASINIYPDSINVTLPCNDSIQVPVSFVNNGLGDLYVQSVLQTEGERKLEVLLLSYGARFQDEIPNSLNAVNHYFNNYHLSIYGGTDPLMLQSLLHDKDLVFIPGNYLNAPVQYEAIGKVVHDFVSDGGGVIFLNGSSDYVGNILSFDLIHPTRYRYGYGVGIATGNSLSHPLMYQVSPSFQVPAYTHMLKLKDVDRVKLIDLNGMDVLSYRHFGKGKVVFIAFDFYGYTDVNFAIEKNPARIISNAFQWAANSSHHEFNPALSGDTLRLQPGDSLTVPVFISSSNLLPGTYSSGIIINSNDPLHRTDTIPVTLTVSGSPELHLSASCLNFSSSIQYKRNVDTLFISNSGCDVLRIDSITLTGVDFTVENREVSILPGDTNYIVVCYLPQSAGNHSGALLLHSNQNDTSVCINASVTASPQIQLSLDSIVVNLACGATTTLTVQIGNTGGSQLSGSLNHHSRLAQGLNILIIQQSLGTSVLSPLQTAIRAAYPDVHFISTLYNDVNTLNTYLPNTDLVLCAPTSTNVSGFPDSISAILADWVNNSGGTVVFFGASNPLFYFSGSGLFEGSVYGEYMNGTVEKLTTHPVTDGLPSLFSGTRTAYATHIQNADVIKLLDLNGFDFLSYRTWGRGKAFYLANDLWQADTMIRNIIPNIVAWTGHTYLAPWISVTPENFSINPASTSTIQVQISAGILRSGTYTSDILFTSDSHGGRTDTIHCVMNISGGPSLSLSRSCIDFDTSFVGQQLLDSITLQNTGCDTLFISSISGSVPGVTCSGFPPYILPFYSAKIYLFISPSASGNFLEYLNIYNSAHDTAICLRTVSILPPVVDVQPDSINLTLQCRDSATVYFTLRNTGTSTLQFTTNHNPGIDDSLNVLVFLSQNPSYVNNYLMPQLQQYYPSAKYSTFGNTNPDSVRKSLQYRDVLILPLSYYEDTLQLYANSQNISEFAAKGGTVIFTFAANRYLSWIGDMGLFHGTYIGYSYNQLLTIKNPNHPLAFGFTEGIVGTYNFSMNSFTDANRTDILVNENTVSGYPGQIVSTRDTGFGRAVFISMYDVSDLTMHFLSNAMRWGGSLSHAYWLSVQNNANELLPGDSIIIPVMVNDTGLLAGNYYSNILISSNDPLHPIDTIPVHLTVNGQPEIALSTSCLSFDTVQVDHDGLRQMMVYNRGCDTLFLSSFTSTLTNCVVTASMVKIFPGDSSMLSILINSPNTGSFSSSFTIHNNDRDTSICLNGFISSPPEHSISPMNINVSLSCADSAIVPINLSNQRGGVLEAVNVSRGGAAALARVLILTYGVDSATSVVNTVYAIKQYFSAIQVTYLNTTDPNVVSTAVINSDVVVLPQNSYGDFAVFNSLRSVLDNFSSQGGTVIYFGFWSQNNTSASSYMGTDYYYTILSSGVQINFNNPLVDGLPNLFSVPGYVSGLDYPYSLQTVLYDLSYYGTVAGYANVGSGKQIYIGFDYNHPTNETSMLAANAVRWGAENVSSRWIRLSSDTTYVYAGNSVPVNVTVSSLGFSPGIYSDTILLQTNDPLHEYDTVFVSMTVTGSAAIAVSDTCISFGLTMQHTLASKTLTIRNPGCDSLDIFSFQTQSPYFTVNGNTGKIAGGDSILITIQFLPDTSGLFTDTLRIFNSDHQVYVCLSGDALGAASITFSPASLGFTLQCDDSASVTLNLNNTGLSDLEYSIDAYATEDTIIHIGWASDSYLMQRFMAILNSSGLSYSITTLTSALSDTALFKKWMVRCDVLIFNSNSYGQYDMLLYAGILQRFVSQGGTVLFHTEGYSNGITLFNSGLFHGTITNGVYSSVLDIVQSAHPVVAGIPSPFNNISYSNSFRLTDTDRMKIVDFLGNDVISTRDIGKGRAIVFGLSIGPNDSVHVKLLLNTILWSGRLSHKRLINADTPSGIISAGGMNAIQLSVHSGGLSTGIYMDTLWVYSNDPQLSTVFIPYQIQVNGFSGLTLSRSCIDFGNTNSGTSLDSIQLFATGCDSLVLDSMTHSLVEFHIDYLPEKIKAGAYRSFNIEFHTSVPGEYFDTLYLWTSAIDTFVCLHGRFDASGYNAWPDSFTVTLGNCRDSVTFPLLVTNSGNLDLQAQVQNSGLLGQRIEILALTYGTDLGTEYPNTIEALRSRFSMFNLEEVNTTDSAVLRQSLSGKDILLVPEPEFANPSVYLTLGIVMQEFVMNGGTVILCGANGTTSDYIFNSGLFQGTFASNVSGFPVILQNYSDPLASGVDTLFAASSGTYALSLSDTDRVVVASSNAYDIVTYRSIGFGRVIFLAFDYFNYDLNSALLLSNAVQQFGSIHHHNWISVDPDSVSVIPGSTETFNITFTTQTLDFGVHHDTLFISTNDPLNPIDTIPCTLIVNTKLCADFGSLSACDGTVAFFDSSANNPVSWQWDFGDLSTSTSRNPVHRYTASGNYPVTLIASNSLQSDTMQSNIDVHIMQEIHILDSGSVVTGLPIYFFSDDTTGVQWQWDFGDGSGGTGISVSHVYNSQGVYEVVLNSLDSAGCMRDDTLSIAVIINGEVELEHLYNISVYPNPSTGDFELTFKTEKEEQILIDIYDLIGRKVNSVMDEPRVSPGSHSMKVHLDSQGYYFIRCRFGKRVTVLRLICLQ